MGLQVHFGCIEIHCPFFLAFPATYQQTKCLLLLTISYFLFYSKISRKPVLCSTCHHRIPVRTLAAETLMSCLVTGRRKTLRNTMQRFLGYRYVLLKLQFWLLAKEIAASF